MHRRSGAIVHRLVTGECVENLPAPFLVIPAKAGMTIDKRRKMTCSAGRCCVSIRPRRREQLRGNRGDASTFSASRSPAKAGAQVRRTLDGSGASRTALQLRHGLRRGTTNLQTWHRAGAGDLAAEHGSRLSQSAAHAKRAARWRRNRGRPDCKRKEYWAPKRRAERRADREGIDTPARLSSFIIEAGKGPPKRSLLRDFPMRWFRCPAWCRCWSRGRCRRGRACSNPLRCRSPSPAPSHWRAARR